jgi:hypothetical protein
MPFRSVITGVLISAAISTCSPALAATTDFSNGSEGWTGNAVVDPISGKGGGAGFRTEGEFFYPQWSNNTNAAFLGDYTLSSAVSIGLDVFTNHIIFRDSEVPRDLFVKLISYGLGDEITPGATLYFKLGEISVEKSDWQHFSTSIDDTASDALPPGWNVVDGNGKVGLKSGVTFSDLLSQIDEIQFSTAEPNLLYGDAYFDVVGDNFSINKGAIAAVPEPATWALLIVGFAAVGASMRRKQRKRAPHLRLRVSAALGSRLIKLHTEHRRATTRYLSNEVPWPLDASNEKGSFGR